MIKNHLGAFVMEIKTPLKQRFTYGQCNHGCDLPDRRDIPAYAVETAVKALGMKEQKSVLF